MKRDNLSTQHQKPGDARRPSDTLDRDADSTDYLNGGDRGRAKEEAREGREDPALAHHDRHSGGGE